MNYTFLLYADDKTQKVSVSVQKRVDLGAAPDYVTYKDELYELREENGANLSYVKKNSTTCVALT